MWWMEAVKFEVVNPDGLRGGCGVDVQRSSVRQGQ